MSTHSLAKINQKEYLKKYLSGHKVKKKKKDKKHKNPSTSAKVKIIDDDINNFDTGLEIDEELLLAGEDAPQIVGEYIEEKLVDRKVPKWKSIVKDEQDDNDASNKQDARLWGSKTEKVRAKDKFAFKNKSNKSPDNSPPRRNEQKRNSPSSQPRRNRKSPPPRKPECHKIKTEQQSPRFNKRESSDAVDASSPRRKNSDQSPIRRDKYHSKHKQKRLPHTSYQSENVKNHSTFQSPVRHRIDSDQSPPRKHRDKEKSSYQQRSSVHPSSSDRTRSQTRNDRSTLLSPNRGRSDSDQTPPRRSAQSPRRHRRDSDQSPPRKGNRQFLEQSPPIKVRNPSNQSPAAKNRNSSYRQRRKTPDYSPPRKSRRSPDQSPPRRKRKTVDSSPNRIKCEKRTPDLSPQPGHSRWEKHELEKSLSPPPTHRPKPGKTLDGKKAGLQDAQGLHKENFERRKHEDLLFEKMSSNVSGRNAEVQVRSTGRKGRRAKEADEEDPRERRRKEEHEEKKKLIYDRWGKGLKQIEDHKNRMIEQEYESSKPFARYSNDEDLERHLKEQERSEDPMLEYMRQKRKEKEKLSGKPQYPRYEGPYPENRFGIPPGYRWDGVDRSNGYEKKYFAVQSEKRARQDEAYKYSVEDM